MTYQMRDEGNSEGGGLPRVEVWGSWGTREGGATYDRACDPDSQFRQSCDQLKFGMFLRKLDLLRKRRHHDAATADSEINFDRFWESPVRDDKEDEDADGTFVVPWSSLEEGDEGMYRLK